MTIEITVQGSAERRYPAEVGTVWLTVAVEGAERAPVLAAATDVHRDLTAQLTELQSSGAVQRFTAEAVRVVAERPWRPDGSQGDLVQTVRLGMVATFADLDAVGGFVADWSERSEVEIGSIQWGVDEANRRSYEADVRADAVADAVVKAQAYADAVAAEPVRPTHLSDPGMLTPPESAPMMRAAMTSAAGGGLDLRPGEIRITAEVDARFVTP